MTGGTVAVSRTIDEILEDIVAASGRRRAIVVFPALSDIVEGDDDF